MLCLHRSVVRFALLASADTLLDDQHLLWWIHREIVHHIRFRLRGFVVRVLLGSFQRRSFCLALCLAQPAPVEPVAEDPASTEEPASTAEPSSSPISARDDGNAYYHNLQTGQTQWDRPAVVEF